MNFPCKITFIFVTLGKKGQKNNLKSDAFEKNVYICMIKIAKLNRNMRFHECVKRVSLFAAALLVLAGCKENVDTSARYVFKEETIMSYLKKHEAYSEYVNSSGSLMAKASKR